MEEYRGTERRNGSSSCLMWWQQKMNPEEDNGGKGQGIFPRLFYDEAGNEVDTEAQVEAPDPHERFMDCPDAAPDNFNRGVDLDNIATPAPPKGQKLR